MENPSKSNQKTDNLELYNRVRSVPENALRKIEAGRLKGKSDINPMFRIQTLTREFGEAGFGWYTSVDREWTEIAENGEIAVFIDISLYVRKDGEWSKPIHGTGGNKLVSLERKWENGEQVISTYIDDEAYKKAYTDAISVAAKALGIGADVYWEADKTKYSPRPSDTERQAAYNRPAGEGRMPALSPDSRDWKQAVAFTAKLNADADEIRTRVQNKYVITTEDFNLLLKQAGKSS